MKDIKALARFLREAKKDTYASATAKNVESLRPFSKDYEFRNGEWVYHDTYFGGSKFIGEEIVYFEKRPIWGMNYNGYIVDDTVTESDIDKSLRPALQKYSEDVIPVRGPKKFVSGDYVYTNDVKGELFAFEGREEIRKRNKLIYFAIFHGGQIQ